MTAALALEIRGLSKTFGSQRALKDFDFDVREGEIHALVGENGSGKSTTVKCLSGYHEPDPGAEILVGGKSLPLPYGPDQAHFYGLSFVHQDIGLIPSLNVLANLSFGQPVETGFGWRLKERDEARRASVLLARLGHADIDPHALVKDLSIAARTVVAIARCLRNDEDAKVMVLDEPTAALPQSDVQRLFGAFRHAVARGHAIVYISHRLEEIFEIADRITVLRDGSKIATVTRTETTQNELVSLMIGRSIDSYYPQVSQSVEESVVLRTEGLCGRIVKDASFSVRRGEVLGVAGLLGSGKSELGRLLFGAQKSTSGKIVVDGKPVSIRSPADAVSAGIAMVPANRHRDAVVLGESVLENLTLLDLADLRRVGRVKDRPRRALAERMIAKFEVRPANPDRLIAALSGGNQQKVVLAKWMHRKPSLLILDEPAQGIDIGAKAQIFRLLEDAARDGMSLLILSEEFEDLAHLCDRVLVMRGGRIAAELSGKDKTRERIAGIVYQEATVS